MWQRTLDDQLAPEEIRGLTTSIWECFLDGKKVAIVGVMYPILLGPPVLWMEFLGTTARNLRKLPDLAREFCQSLSDPIVYAEARKGDHCSLNFLGKAGFTIFAETHDRFVMRLEL